jgi:hypothetical protein
MVRNSFEGTWEELLRRAEQFSGRRVRLTVLDEVPVHDTTTPAVSWDTLLAGYVGAFSSPTRTNRAECVEEIWGDSVLEKHRKQQEPRS